MKRASRRRKERDFVVMVGRALIRSARTARKVAKMHGTPIHIWRNGRVVAEKP